MFNINLIIDIVVDIFYPTRCIACEKILGKTEIKSGFCKECRGIIRTARRDICMICGRPMKDSAKEYCESCLKTKHRFDSARAIYEYVGPIKNSMYRFKYANKRSYAKVYAKEAINIHGDWIKAMKPQVIVPVPMFKTKERTRGYNQAELFAKELSKESGIKVCNAVKRIKNTKPLKTLSPSERRQNLKNAFKKVKRLPENVDILIVDDIYTTGTTVDELSFELKKHRIRNIYCLFICTGRRI